MPVMEKLKRVPWCGWLIFVGTVVSGDGYGMARPGSEALALSGWNAARKIRRNARVGEKAADVLESMVE